MISLFIPDVFSRKGLGDNINIVVLSKQGRDPNFVGFVVTVFRFFGLSCSGGMYGGRQRCPFNGRSALNRDHKRKTGDAIKNIKHCQILIQTNHSETIKLLNFKV